MISDLNNDLTAAKKSFDNTRSHAAKLSGNLSRVASWGAGGLGTLALLTAPAPPVSIAFAGWAATLSGISTSADLVRAGLSIGLENQNENILNAAKLAVLDKVGGKILKEVVGANKGLQELVEPTITGAVEASKATINKAASQVTPSNDESANKEEND